MIRKKLVSRRADVTLCGQAAALPGGPIGPKKMLDVPGRIWQDNKTGRNLDFGNSAKVGLLPCTTLRGGGKTLVIEMFISVAGMVVA